MEIPPSTPTPASWTVPRVKMGTQGMETSAQGLGCQGMAGDYGPPMQLNDMTHLLNHAVSRGVTLLDSSDYYGDNYINETLLGQAIKGIRHKVQLCTKFGVKRTSNGVRVFGDPAYVRASCEASLKRLDVDYIDLYYQHRVDTTIPIEITVGEMKKLVEEGKVKYIGLCEPSVETIRRAHAVHPITTVQIEWSLWSRDIEEEIIPTCRELGIGIVAYSPLGRGLLSYGPNIVKSFSEKDKRKQRYPRFQAENLKKNNIAYETVSNMASKKGCSTSQLALAWVHHKGHDVVPIPGTTKLKNLDDNIASLSIKITPTEMREIEDAISSIDIGGDRYPETSMHTSWRFSNTPPFSCWKKN